MNGVTGTVGNVLGGVTGTAKRIHWYYIVSSLTDTVDDVSGGTNGGLLSGVTGAVDGILGAGPNGGILTGLTNSVGGVVGNLLDGVTNTVEGLLGGGGATSTPVNPGGIINLPGLLFSHFLVSFYAIPFDSF